MDIKNFEGWRAEQLTKKHLSIFNNIFIQESNKVEIDYLISFDYGDFMLKNLFGLEVKASSSPDKIKNVIEKAEQKYTSLKYPVLLFVFDMNNDSGKFAWILKPLKTLKFSRYIKFYNINNKAIAGLVGIIENWYFENKKKSETKPLFENWVKKDKKRKKYKDRFYFSPTEDWEIDYLIDKYQDLHPNLSSSKIKNTIRRCVSESNLPYPRKEIERCIMTKLK